MKNLILILVVLLLSACTRLRNSQQDVFNSVSLTPEATVDYMHELIMTAAKSSFSEGPHMHKFSCDTCHSGNGSFVETKLIWLNETTKQVESISTTKELCGKCHPEQNMQKEADSDKLIAHKDYECTACHQPHTTQASCTQSTCHIAIRNIITAQIEIPQGHPSSGDPNGYMCGASCHDLAKQALASPIYHQPVHRQVPCYVCHDASGLLVTPTNDNISWITAVNDLPSNNSASGKVVSHQIGRKVDCTKCHYIDNPWGLAESVDWNKNNTKTKEDNSPGNNSLFQLDDNQ